MSRPPTPSRLPRRADALRNRRAVVAAAAAVFSELGPDVGIGQIAKRANVGKATVYRSFPTKQHLVAAVVTEHVRGITAQAQEWLDDVTVDGWTAVREVLLVAAGTPARGLLTQPYDELADPEHQTAKARSRVVAERLLERGRMDGTVRSDIGHDEVATLFRGMTLALLERGVGDDEIWLRHADLVASAIRPSPESEHGRGGRWTSR